MYRLKFFTIMTLLVVMSILPCGIGQRDAQAVPVLTPGVDYSKPNFAYSPPLRKFVDSLAGVGAGARAAGTALGASTLGQYMPIATPNVGGALPGFPNDDYYVIALVEYKERLHSDLPASGTTIRGYVQVVPSGTAGAVPLTTANGLTQNAVDNLGAQLYGADKPHYLGPLIIATKNRPVRIKFINALPPTGAGGNLFIPVDVTMMGAGEGPLTAGGAACDPADTGLCQLYGEPRHAPSPRRHPSMDQRRDGPPVDRARPGHDAI